MFKNMKLGTKIFNHMPGNGGRSREESGPSCVRYSKDVYVTTWEASGGVNLKGLIPGRAEDNLGLGVAALITDSPITKMTRSITWNSTTGSP
jgi:hypothetical protein